MDGVGAGRARDVEDQIAAQIGFAERARGRGDTLRRPRGRGERRDRRRSRQRRWNAQLAAGTHDAQGDFATIRDEDLADFSHGGETGFRNRHFAGE